MAILKKEAEAEPSIANIQNKVNQLLQSMQNEVLENTENDDNIEKDLSAMKKQCAKLANEIFAMQENMDKLKGHVKLTTELIVKNMQNQTVSVPAPKK